jgi:hypothetical protein
MDLETIETASFVAGEEHRWLATLAGQWSGTARTWLDPTKPPLEAGWSGRIALVLGGRFARWEYRSSIDGKPIAGEMLIAHESGEKLWRLAWIDSFHTSPAILVSTGVAGASRCIDATGHYFVGEGHPRWGWRTEIGDPVGDTLGVRMFNVMPEGKEELAIEITLRR